MPGPLAGVLDGGNAVRQFGHVYRELGAVPLLVVCEQVGGVVVRHGSHAGAVADLADVGARLDVAVDHVLPDGRLVGEGLVAALVRAGERLVLQTRQVV